LGDELFEEFAGRFYYLLHPRPTVVIGTLCPNGRTNFMPASWNTPVSEEPPTVAVAVDSEAYTRECLDYCGEASLNILSLDDVQLLYDLGSVSGRDVDKVSRFRLELLESLTIKPPGILRSLAILESKVVGKYLIGESVLYVFEVKKVRVRSGVADKFGFILSEKINIPLHASGRYFYGVGARKLATRKVSP